MEIGAPRAGGCTTGVILAAGRGSRLAPLTDETPKCLLEIGNRSLLARAISAFQEVGIHDIRVVTGHAAAKVAAHHWATIFNPSYQADNIAGSFFEARQVWRQGAIVAYSDIVFAPEILHDLMSSPAQVAVAVDPEWKSRYVGRSQHPASEAELVRTDSRGDVLEIAKNLGDASDIHGEFLGLLKLMPPAANRVFDEVESRFRSGPGVYAWRTSYLATLLTDLVATGLRIEPVLTRAWWFEVDTRQDLENARRAVASLG